MEEDILGAGVDDDDDDDNNDDGKNNIKEVFMIGI